MCKKLLGIEEEEGGLVDLGEVTTPQLHWVVGYKNGGGEERGEYFFFLLFLIDLFTNFLFSFPK